MVSHLLKDSLHASFDLKVFCMPSPTYYRPVKSTDPIKIARRTLSSVIACLFNGSYIEARFCTNLDIEGKFNILKVNLVCLCVQKGWTKKAP